MIVDFFTIDQWKDAVLGAVLGVLLSGLFAGSRQIALKIRDSFPKRSLLRPWVGSSDPVRVVLRTMFGDSTTYQSSRPQLVGVPRAALPPRQWVNIHDVYGTADVQAAAEVAQLLGEAGTPRSIVLSGPETVGTDWNTPAILIGGHDMTDAAMELFRPMGITHDPANPDHYTVHPSGETFRVGGRLDYGAVVKGLHPQTGKAFLVIQGLGSLGTAAAARYVRVRARTLGLAYGNRPFCLLIAADVAQGVDSAHGVHATPARGLRRVFQARLVRRDKAIEPPHLHNPRLLLTGA